MFIRIFIIHCSGLKTSKLQNTTPKSFYLPSNIPHLFFGGIHCVSNKCSLYTQQLVCIYLGIETQRRFKGTGSLLKKVLRYKMQKKGRIKSAPKDKLRLLFQVRRAREKLDVKTATEASSWAIQYSLCAIMAGPCFFLIFFITVLLPLL